jgi:hypothetical protein
VGHGWGAKDNGLWPQFFHALDSIFETEIRAQTYDLPGGFKMTRVPVDQAHHLPTGLGATLLQWPPPAVSDSDQQNPDCLFDGKPYPKTFSLASFSR